MKINEQELFSTVKTSSRVNQWIDQALAKHREAPRDYLGASLLGDPCLRRIAYTLEGVETPFSGTQLRIFEIGHTLEPLVASWLQKAGFRLKTKDEKGKQFGFSQAGGRLRGHVDGLIEKGPLQAKYPLLWECKTMKASCWRELSKTRLEIANERYYAQIQLYMAYRELEGCLFTALNKDTAELYHELVSFDGRAASDYSDRAVRILQALDHGEPLPRLAKQSDFFICKTCPFRQKCWE